MGLAADLPSITVGPTAGATDVGVPSSRITGVGHFMGTKQLTTTGDGWL
jgi:hypothetical protein